MAKPRPGESPSPDKTALPAADLPADGGGVAPADREAAVAASMAERVQEAADAVCQKLEAIIEDIRRQAAEISQQDARGIVGKLPRLNAAGMQIAKTASELEAGVRETALEGFESADDLIQPRAEGHGLGESVELG